MKSLAGYVSDYILSLDKGKFLFIALVLSGLTAVNYTFNLNSAILAQSSGLMRAAGLFLLYFFAFSTSYFIDNKFKREGYFYFLLILAPLLFAAKAAFRYEDVILQWPLKALIILLPLLLVSPRTLGLSPGPLRPYAGLLILMVPLILWAATQPDFQRVYPRLRLLGEDPGTLRAILFELSYGLDFFTIELFFRGFLVVTFSKYVGKGAILPMAVFYCTIHFGKPLAECISSFLGGLILGAIVYNTRSIWGGLLVHLGIAWMMELAGYWL